MNSMACCFSVSADQTAIIERWGSFKQQVGPGLHFKVPFMDSVRGKVSMRVHQLDVSCETKTSNNVFLTVVVSIQYEVIPTKVREAYYRLLNPGAQITSYVFDVIRANVPSMELNEVFTNKENIATQVKEDLRNKMDDYGYRILDALVTDIDPNKEVKKAMNDIEASKRFREAALEKAEAEKIIKVKEAEADAESKFLSGQGIARQRQAIIHGLQESVSQFSDNLGVSAEEVMHLILMTQYFDTLQQVSDNSHTNTIMLPHGPGAVHDFGEQLRFGNYATNITNTAQQQKKGV